ncbi:hypothetical protein [Algiphilus sp.]|uniref:DUF6918 family protein n=2 Tax=Algiphilus sp. TaxID=1872431 RepID=UPI0025BF3010|nr:hypothetical protein [Algiphilus sp.]MCK5770091.1 hypothetical protein [Algiphilus sp.]
MTQLRERILNSPREGQIVTGCSVMIQTFVSDTGGVRGFALRSAVHAAQRQRPDLLDTAARRLLPEFLDALDPHYAEWNPAAEPDFARFLDARSASAREALIAVADRRARASSNRVVKSLYERMRGSAGKDVDRLLPDLARLIADELDAQRRDGA